MLSNVDIRTCAFLICYGILLVGRVKYSTEVALAILTQQFQSRLSHY